MNPNINESERIQINRYAYVASLYFIVVGVLYLWGYWGSFGINVLEYASISDIAKTTAYPVATAFAFFAVGTIIGGTLTDNKIPEESSPESIFWSLIFRHIKIIGALYLAGVYLLFHFGPEKKWLALPMLITLPIFMATAKLEFLKSIFPNSRTRYVFTYLIIALPFFSYGQGRLNAFNIIEGQSYSYISELTNETKSKDNTTTIQSRHRYLGQVNDYLFFYIPDSQTTSISRFEHIKSIQIAKYEKSRFEKIKPTDKETKGDLSESSQNPTQRKNDSAAHSSSTIDLHPPK